MLGIEIVSKEQIKESLAHNWHKNEELQMLLQNMKSSNELNSFISAGTSGGLVTPCDDLVGIIEEAEVLFRKEVSQSKLVLRNIRTDNICFATLESPTVKYLWDIIVTASGNPTSPTSKLCLEDAVKLYLKVRSFSYAKDYVTKYKIIEKQVKKGHLERT